MMCKCTFMMSGLFMVFLTVLTIIGLIFLFKLIINNNKYKK